MEENNNAGQGIQSRKVFVYGTLKQGFRLHPYMAGAEFIQDDVLQGFEIYSNGSFPMIVRGQGAVKGEVYEVPSFMFKELDMIESAYNRTEVTTESGLKVDAYIYKYPVNQLKKLKSEFELKHQGGLW